MYNLFGFSLSTQKVTISFVKINAVNIDVKIPMLRVTENPIIEAKAKRKRGRPKGRKNKPKP